MSRPLAALERLALDVRTAGAWTPVRAVTDVARLSGATEALVARLARTSPALRTDRSLLVPCAPIPDDIADRTLAAAAEVAAGRVVLFGRVTEVGSPPDWHALLHEPGHWPMARAGSLPLRGDDLLGDPKWTWELARHRHLVLLARAAHLDPDQPRWMEALNAQLVSWVAANPPGVGIHWSATLELSVRAVAWTQVLGLVGARLPGELRAQMATHLWYAAVFLAVELPAVRAGMANNHLLADALGLDVHTRLFEPTSPVRRLGALARRVFANQLARQYELDPADAPGRGGATIEDSVGYDRFVLELVLVRALLDRDDGQPPDERVLRCLRAGAEHLARLGADGITPLLGDADDGRVLCSVDTASTMAGTLATVAAVLGDGAPHGASAHDEVAWHAAVGAPAALPGPERSGHDTGGGIARATVGPFTIWLKGDGGGWHGHADLGSVALAHDDVWLLADPGPFSYNPEARVRQHAVSSGAHDCLTLAGIDQREPYRTFRFRHAPRGHVGAPIALDDAIVSWAWHDAYTRLAPARRVARIAVLKASGLHVIDVIEGAEPIDWAFTLTIPEPATLDGARLTGAGAALELVPPSASHIAPRTPSDGAQWSPRYGATAPATVVQISGHSTGAICWALTSAPARWQPDGAGATDGTHHLEVMWLHDGVRVDVR